LSSSVDGSDGLENYSRKRIRATLIAGNLFTEFWGTSSTVTPDFDGQAFYTSLLRKFRDEGW